MHIAMTRLFYWQIRAFMLIFCFFAEFCNKNGWVRIALVLYEDKMHIQGHNVSLLLRKDFIDVSVFINCTCNWAFELFFLPFRSIHFMLLPYKSAPCHVYCVTVIVTMIRWSKLISGQYCKGYNIIHICLKKRHYHTPGMEFGCI